MATRSTSLDTDGHGKCQQLYPETAEGARTLLWTGHTGLDPGGLGLCMFLKDFLLLHALRAMGTT